jgi:hypothetical protein
LNESKRTISNADKKCVEWPGKSPDLLAIGTLRIILKKMVKHMNPQTIDDLKTALIAASTLIPQSSISFAKALWRV